MNETLPTLVSLLADEIAVLGAIIAAAFATYRKYLKPWADKVDARTKSTDNAVNHGRMPRIEKSLDRSSERMDRIEERLDTAIKQQGNRNTVVDRRFANLEEGQTKILDELANLRDLQSTTLASTDSNGETND